MTTLVIVLTIIGVAAALLLLFVGAAMFYFGGMWLQAYTSGAYVSLFELIGMRLRRVSPQLIVTAKIMAHQAGLHSHQDDTMSTSRLEAHVLAGGDLMRVVTAIIAADRAGINLGFDQAAAIDLAGRDVLDAVRTSVSPKVINCPQVQKDGKTTISAVAQDGVELHVRARVTVRTNLAQLIGGATEETIIARVNHGIIAAIGGSITHREVMSTPDRISQSVLKRGLDANTAFEIVSIDIADVEVGQNIGARLQFDQADADVRVARARAEMRRAEAIALSQQMTARVVKSRAMLLEAEAEIPMAIGESLRAGHRMETVEPLRIKPRKSVIPQPLKRAVTAVLTTPAPPTITRDENK